MPMYDDPTDEMMKGPHAEPDEDESYIDDVMGENLEDDDEELFNESPLEQALKDAGYNVTPDQVSQIEGILKGGGGKPPMGKPPMGGMGGKMPGGAVPGAMGSSDIPGM